MRGISKWILALGFALAVLGCSNTPAGTDAGMCRAPGASCTLSTDCCSGMGAPFCSDMSSTCVMCKVEGDVCPVGTPGICCTGLTCQGAGFCMP